MKIDIYNYDRKINAEIINIEKSSMTKRNKEIIFQFKDSCFMDGLSKARVCRILNIMKLIALRMNVDFDKAKKENIMKFVQGIQTNDNYTAWTKQTYKCILKKFYKWFKGNNKKYPDEVEWINTNIKRNELRLPSEEGLITEEEVKKLVDAADTPRNKALISVLYESGCRIGEILSCKINSLTFDELGCNLVVNGKTGARKVRLIASTPYLANWLEHHPYKDNESPLWVNIGNKKKCIHMMYPNMRFLLKTLFKKVGIKKRFNPHLFRHSRATFLASYLTEFQMNQYLGWIQGSKMPHTYVHMSGKDVDNAILAVNGIKIEKKNNETILQSQKCPRCSTVNGFNNKFCSKCGAVLDMKTAIEMEENRKEEITIRNTTDNLMRNLLQDPEINQILVRKIKEMGLAV